MPQILANRAADLMPEGGSIITLSYGGSNRVTPFYNVMGVAKAALLPGLSLSGSLLRNRFSGSGTERTFNTWAIGPISLSLPLLAESRTAYGPQLEGFSYPHPLKHYRFESQGKALEMAFMDVEPQGKANGRTALLLHGKNFNADYWAGTARHLQKLGYASLTLVRPGLIGGERQESRPAEQIGVTYTLFASGALGTGAEAERLIEGGWVNEDVLRLQAAQRLGPILNYMMCVLSQRNVSKTLTACYASNGLAPLKACI